MTMLVYSTTNLSRCSWNLSSFCFCIIIFCWVFNPLLFSVLMLLKRAHSTAWVVICSSVDDGITDGELFEKLFAWERNRAKSWRCRLLFRFEIFTTISRCDSFLLQFSKPILHLVEIILSSTRGNNTWWKNWNLLLKRFQFWSQSLIHKQIF